VYLGENANQPNQQVALKSVASQPVLDPEERSPCDEAIAEAKLLQRLNHPNIITCHEWFVDACTQSTSQKVWLVLDVLDGGDLQAMYKERRRSLSAPFDAVALRRVMSCVGSALDHVHSMGSLHRDVKCANVLLSKDLGKIVLADFGLACSQTEAASGRELAVGTPTYLPPEVLTGRPHSTASDAWALGVISFKLAALRQPFEARDSQTLTMKIVKNEPRELPAFCAADIACAVTGFLMKDQQVRLRPAEAMVLTSEAPIAKLSRNAFKRIPRRLSAL